MRILKNLILAGYSPEHDVSGVSDPFLQVKILRLLRILGHNDPDASEAMNDILAQVATNTETSKNVGNTILYETVLSIMDIRSEGGLRVLAVNSLGRFLLNSDKNIRYVALNTLLRTVHADTSAVQRHRTTILECLKDPDVSIRRRAMELSFALINGQNIRSMAKELLIFLDKSDSDFKAQVSSRMVLSAERYAPTVRWHLDTILSVLISAGNYLRDDVVSSTIQLISSSPPLEQAYITARLWETLQMQNNCEDKQPVLQVAVWSIGEYGDLFMYAEKNDDVERPTEEQLIELFNKLMWSAQVSITSKQYTILSLAKLSTRLQSGQDDIKKLVDGFGSHLNVDLQQRGCEISQLFRAHSNLRPALLEKMPPMVVSRVSNQNGSSSGTPEENGSLDLLENGSMEDGGGEQTTTTAGHDSLLDLLGGTDGPMEPAPIQLKSLNNTNTNNNSSNNNQDLLDLLGGLDLSSPAATITPIDSNNGFNSIMSSDADNLNLGGLIGQTIPSSIISGGGFLDDLNSVQNLTSTEFEVYPKLVALDKNGIFCQMSPQRGQGCLQIFMTATNNSLNTVEQFLFQVIFIKNIC